MDSYGDSPANGRRASSGSVGKGTIRTHIFNLLCHELSHDPTTVISIRL